MKPNERPVIAQITWINYYNYGTFLQAYALQRVLKELGFNSFIIDDKNFHPYASNKLSAISKVKGLVKLLIYRRELIRIKKFKKFAYNFLKIDRQCNTFQDIAEKYSVYICGSDQIWSPLLPNQSEGYYFATFAKEDSTKIAYGASFGTSEYDESYAMNVKQWLKNFSALSVRENPGIELLSRLSNREDIEEVIDPTLLLSSNKWKNLISARKLDSLNKEYLLCYFLDFNQTYMDKCREIAESKNLKLYAFGNNPKVSKFADKIINAGPLEFLEAIANSSFFMTDSFHGTIFALQYHSHFLTFKRFKGDDKKNQNIRIENLLKKLNLENNFISNTHFCSLPRIPDWNDIDATLQSLRSSSISFLKKALHDI